MRADIQTGTERVNGAITSAAPRDGSTGATLIDGTSIGRLVRDDVAKEVARLKTLGVVEVAIAGWVMSGIAPGACAIVQTALLVALNANGLLWARRVIHDPAGMVVKNIAFLVLAWVCGAMAGGRP